MTNIDYHIDRTAQNIKKGVKKIDKKLLRIKKNIRKRRDQAELRRLKRAKQIEEDYNRWLDERKARVLGTATKSTKNTKRNTRPRKRAPRVVAAK